MLSCTSTTTTTYTCYSTLGSKTVPLYVDSGEFPCSPANCAKTTVVGTNGYSQPFRGNCGR